MVFSAIRMLRTHAVLVLVVALGLAAAGAVTVLERHADAGSQAQAEISAIELHLGNLENAPITATALEGPGHSKVRKELAADSAGISSGLSTLISAGNPPSALLRVPPAGLRGRSESCLQRRALSCPAEDSRHDQGAADQGDGRVSTAGPGRTDLRSAGLESQG
jgi:hypothetical protein